MQLDEKDFPFSNATNAGIIVTERPDAVYFDDGEAYTFVPIEHMADYLSQLSYECKEKLRRDIEYAMKLLRASYMEQNNLLPSPKIWDLRHCLLLLCSGDWIFMFLIPNRIMKNCLHYMNC